MIKEHGTQTIELKLFFKRIVTKANATMVDILDIFWPIGSQL